jgi:hypothetical protein
LDPVDRVRRHRDVVYHIDVRQPRRHDRSGIRAGHRLYRLVVAARLLSRPRVGRHLHAAVVSRRPIPEAGAGAGWASTGLRSSARSSPGRCSRRGRWTPIHDHQPDRARGVPCRWSTGRIRERTGGAPDCLRRNGVSCRPLPAGSSIRATQLRWFAAALG